MEIRRRIFADDADLPKGLHPLLQQLYAARQVRSPEELNYELSALHAPDSLGGIGEAAALLAAHLDKRILVVGDFDVDGATSTALALLGLRALGAKHVDYLVPDRFRFGYGLTPGIVALGAERDPDLIVTVDNGISSIEGVRHARERGIRVLITDHHLPGSERPEADVIVNPNLPGDAFPSKALAGVGVMFYVLLALRKYLRETGKLVNEPNLANLLDLVALGTVADVVPLDANNRRLVHQGLRRIRAGACRLGILALIDVAGRSRANLSASDLGFALGPRLNAAGRLDDMSIGIECLLTEDPVRALRLAAELDQLNRERRDIERQMQEEALASLETLQLSDDLPVALCLYQAEWHQGVVGILASRIKDRTHRPVIAFAQAETGSTQLKGSARSVKGLHIRDALDAIATRHPGLIDRFGGHAMAAGLTLDASRLADFEQAFAEEAARWLNADELRGVLKSDGELAPEYLSIECAEMLRDAGPWGQGFPEPLFDGEFELLDRRIVGERHLKLRLGISGAAPLDGIAFNQADALPETGCRRVRAAYRLDVNEWQGLSSAQLLIEYLEPA